VPSLALGITLPVYTDSSAGPLSKKGRKVMPAFSSASGGFLPSLGSGESLVCASPAQQWQFYVQW